MKTIILRNYFRYGIGVFVLFLALVSFNTVVTQAVFIDTDGDGVADDIDNCVNDSNADQADADGDGVGDVCDETPDTTAPTGRVTDPDYDYGELSGTSVTVYVDARDSESLVKEVCLQKVFRGVESTIACMALSERDGSSYDYAPSFTFNWDISAAEDGLYNLFADLVDNAGNEAETEVVDVVINNQSEGSSVQPAEITNCTELQKMDNHLNWHYKLMNDIDCAETTSWNGGQGFDQIGTPSIGFVGSLDGQNYHIYNLFQNQRGTNSGVFYYQQGEVKRVNFRDIDIRCNSTYCGAVAYLNGEQIYETSVTGTLSCSGKCGVFAAQNSGRIEKSWADVKVGNGGYIGGLAGQNYGGAIEDCYFKGVVVGGDAGGVVGLNENTAITTSYSTARVSTGDRSGGLIGWQYNGGNQRDSYWNVDTSGKEEMCGTNGTNCDDSHGLTNEEMKVKENFVGFDFDKVWAINPEKNDGYPYLKWQTSFTGTEPADETAPVITLIGDAEVEVNLGDKYEDEGATATDDKDGDLTKKIKTTGNVDTSIVGTYVITYYVSDEAGNDAKTVERKVIVVEKTTGGGGSESTRVGTRSTKVEAVQEPVQEREGLVLGETTVGKVQNKHQFTKDLYQGMNDPDIVQLQAFLRAAGFFNYPTDTGYFGPITRAAVIQYQKYHGVTPSVGYVGPLTRAWLNL
ncbi:DUF5011 domain-containing protein [Candidatus Nomurabacteria bacterium]|nr:DUF5011 domain-containing protein [Candidatus Nomurabacteria bacterium]